jgi:hypothetical protein
MIRDMVRGGPSERIRITPEERETAIQAVRGQYPRAVVELIIGASWLIFLGGRNFGYLQSHLGLIIAGIGASTGFGWIVTLLIKKWLSHNSTTP